MKDNFITTLLRELGENPDREGLRKTPDRWLCAMRELTSGYKKSPEEIVEGALTEAAGEDFVIVKDIAFASLCEHHLLPFTGIVHIGYLPGKFVVGLSKIPRIVEIFARRLQAQERLGEEIVDAVERVLSPKGAGVVIEATHNCMQIRGVKKESAVVRTHHFRGELKRSVSAREEFLGILDP